MAIGHEHFDQREAGRARDMDPARRQPMHPPSARAWFPCRTCCSCRTYTSKAVGQTLREAFAGDPNMKPVTPRAETAHKNEAQATRAACGALVFFVNEVRSKRSTRESPNNPCQGRERVAEDHVSGMAPALWLLPEVRVPVHERLEVQHVRAPLAPSRRCHQVWYKFNINQRMLDPGDRRSREVGWPVSLASLSRCAKSGVCKDASMT